MKLVSFLLVSCFASFSISAQLSAAEIASEVAGDGQPAESVSIDTEFSEQKRWDIKRQVMSRPGVMLDMANMTDNGYTWKNDVVWAGAGLPLDEKWYVAGFLFQRPRYKAVWLQYAFRLDEATGQLRNVKRWYGAGSIR